MKTLLTALFLLCTLFACKKEDPSPDSLPPITQEGKNTFGCYINGEVWVPYTYGILARKITPVFGNSTRIEVQRYEDPDATDKQQIILSFVIDKVNPIRTYSLGLSEKDAFAMYFDRQSCRYLSDPEDVMEGSITITKYDLTEEKVIAGTFEFTLGKEDCETLHFTEGRFDIKVP